MARVCLALALSAAAVIVDIDQASAQDSSALQSLAGNMSASQLMQLQQARQKNGATQLQPSLQSQDTTLYPAERPRRQPPSELERLLSQRANLYLEQFGYDQLGIGRSVTLSQVGGAQDDYILGVGDEIVISLRGQENSETRVTVDRDGRVLLPRLNPVSAGGRNFGDFKRDLIAAIHRGYVSTDAFVSLGQVRQISVMVSGEVSSPGTRTLTGFSTVADAIALSGGVLKSGSLRAVKIKRGGHTFSVDLYSVLTEHATLRKVGLADGDRIVVPAIGPTVAVAGDVRNQGIFELPAGRAAVSVQEALALANRTILPGVYRFSLLRQMPDGRRRLVDVSGQHETIHDGEILFVKMAVDRSLNQIELSGAVASPGVFALGKYKTLHDLLPREDAFDKTAYMLFGYIDRTDPATHLHSAIPFSPKHIIEDKGNVALAGDDVVHIINKREMRALLRWAMQDNKSKASQLLGRQVSRGLNDANAAVNQNRGLNGGNALTGSQGQSAYGQNNAANAQANSNTSQNQQWVGSSVYSANDPSSSNGTNNSDNSAYGQSSPNYPNNYASDQSAYGSAQAQGDNSAGASGVNPSDPQSRNIPGQAASRIGGNAMMVPNGGTITENAGARGAEAISPELARLITPDNDYLRTVLVYYVINVSGALNDPGLYLAAPGTSLTEAMAAAGGLKSDADLSNVEVTSTSLDPDRGMSTTSRKSYSIASRDATDAVTLLPKDGVLVRSVYTNRTAGSVTIAGQVRYPGTYTLLRGDRLSSILARAGGLTEVAYPQGTVFMRQSVAENERQAHLRAAQQIEDQMLTGMSRRTKDSQMSAESFTAVQSYITELKSSPALGRMVVTADPSELAKHPERDPVLEPSDQIVIPPQPFSVSVMGEVLQPNSVPYIPGETVQDYIEKAGGYTQLASEDEVFIVLPNGQAYRDDDSWLSFGGREIPAGSTVYVGRDITGYDLRQGILDVASIFSGFATTAASLAVLMNQ
ncbi:MAG: SLBB domain-containing protein [Rhizomicrobium sp.]